MGKLSQLESMVKVLQEDLKKVCYWLLTWTTSVHVASCRRRD